MSNKNAVKLLFKDLLGNKEILSINLSKRLVGIRNSHGIAKNFTNYFPTMTSNDVAQSLLMAYEDNGISGVLSFVRNNSGHLIYLKRLNK